MNLNTFNEGLLLCTFICAFANVSFSQIGFTDSSNNLANAFITSGAPIGVADLNGDGLDDIVRLHKTNVVGIDLQTESGIFENNFVNISTPGSNWSLCVADYDRNGLNDVFLGSATGSVSRILKAKEDGSYEIVALGGPDIFAQGANFADINKDGHLDLFVCSDHSVNSVYQNDGFGNLSYNVPLMNTETTVESDNSGNYGAIWIDVDNDHDNDLYISKCRQGILDINDPRRLNQLFINDGKNNFTEEAEERGLLPMAQSWCTDFADIDNDGDLDAFVLNHDTTNRLYENDGNGNFTDITAGAGFSPAIDNLGLGIQVKFADFDNDTYVDLVMTSSQGGYKFFRNNGNKTFTIIFGAFQTLTFKMQSMAIGDLNNDGFTDLLAGFGSFFNSPNEEPDKLFLNDGNSNQWIKIRLQGTESNINAIGARLELHGAWGTQVREIRAGEGYGISNSLNAHFGIGGYQLVDSLVVKWPNGKTSTILNPTLNMTHFLMEEGCPPNGMFVNEYLCEGESIIWNGQVIDAEGVYIDTLQAVNGCDSTIYLTAINFPTFNSTEVDSICENSLYTFPDGNEFTITQNTSYTSLLTSEFGCDSLVTTEVFLSGLTSEFTLEINGCFGDQAMLPDGSIITLDMSTQLVSYHTNSVGCDSTSNIVLNVTDSFNVKDTIFTCIGNTVVLPDSTIFNDVSMDFEHVSNLQSSMGCDSIITSSVVVGNIISFTNEINICPGEIVDLPDGSSQVFNQSETVLTTLSSAVGCDTLVSTVVIVSQDYAFTLNDIVCSGESYTFFDGTTINNIQDSISQVSMLTTTDGCDSIITTNLAVVPSSSETINFLVCPGDSLVLSDGSVRYDIQENFFYNDINTTSTGCDSSFFSVVNVAVSYNEVYDTTVCEIGTIDFGIILIEDIVSDTLIEINQLTAEGCDSIFNITVDLEFIDQTLSLDNGTLTANQSGIDYAWFNCDTNVEIFNANNQSFSPTNNGTYAVILDNGSCILDSECIEVIVTDIEELEEDLFDFYPNPVSNQLTIKSNFTSDQLFSVTDIYGNLQMKGMLSSKNTSIDMKDLSPGVYFVNVLVFDKTYSKKLVKF